MGIKEKKRYGDYIVTLSKNVECWFCGKTIKKGDKAVRIYGKNKVYWHNYECIVREQ